MKALTVREPWGYALIYGGKDVENRSWRTDHRGPLAIHTSAKIDTAYIAQCIAGEHFDPSLARGGEPMLLMGGTFRGVVTVTDVHHATDCATVDDDGRPELCSPWAMPDQWHWVVSDPGPLEHPVPAKGRLQLWDPTAEQLRHLEGCVARWITVRVRRGSVHVLPVRDLIVHERTEDCVCGPRAELVQGPQGDGWVQVHHSTDGRKAPEVTLPEGHAHE